MNKQTRTALIQSLTTDFNKVSLSKGDDALADAIRFATRLADAASQGRTDRWKGACTLAGRRVLVAERDQLTTESVRNKCAQGLEAMAIANK
jgi:hypothetical protein